MKEYLLTRIRYSKAKLRNIIYYRLQVEPTVPDRFRCQYMHILRQYRKEAVWLLGEIEKYQEATGDMTTFSGDINFFKVSSGMINPKVKSEECLNTIKNLTVLFK